MPYITGTLNSSCRSNRDRNDCRSWALATSQVLRRRSFACHCCGIRTSGNLGTWNRCEQDGAERYSETLWQRAPDQERHSDAFHIRHKQEARQSDTTTVISCCTE